MGGIRLRQERINELDAFRGIAVMAVVIFHYTTRYEELFSHKDQNFLQFPLGLYGVHLFFIISGFAIYMTLSNSNSIRDFMVKRIIRLYPAYIIAVILTFSLTHIFQLKGRTTSITDGILNLTMLQGFIPGIANVDGVYWSLKVEITFYVLIGLLLTIKLLKKIEYISIVWLLACSVVSLFGSWIPGSNMIKTLLIPAYCNLFIAGIMFYRLKQKLASTNCHVVIGLCLLYQYTFNSVISGTIVLLFFSLFYLIIYDKMKFISIKPLKFLGFISYSLYLVHQNIGYLIIRELENNGYSNNLTIIIPIIFSVILAYFITKFIEKPAQNFALKLYKKSKSVDSHKVIVTQNTGTL
jgi:peptidoglycan/LPS O-acetylase OafA/YrhL